VQRVSSQSLGRWGERLARLYLISKGYRIVAVSWRAGRAGELDLIAMRGDVLAFIEVKTRRTKRFGRAEEAVDVAKQQRVAAVAESFLAQLPEQSPLRTLRCRMDVIAVHRSSLLGWRIRHLPGAFDDSPRRPRSR
jgi:putative endonuclease